MRDKSIGLGGYLFAIGLGCITGLAILDYIIWPIVEFLK